jgi:aspartate-semialdehyde dehydrogenase
MISCAIVGATGLVGQTFLKVLEEKNLNIDKFVLLASKKSKDKTVRFNNKDYIVEELNEDSFNNNRFDYALFSAGGATSEKFIGIAIQNNCTVIDNSSFFRMRENVPLVIPEVNFDSINNKKIISNPNCSTIQAVSVLKPLHDKYKLKRVVYTTFQAVSRSWYKRY